MRVLITGITGFIGSHLAEYCLDRGEVEVFGTVLSHHLGDELKRIEHIKDKIQLFECNLTNRIAVDRVLEKVKPDKIFHLASQSFVLVSWYSPEDTLHNNIMSQLNLFEGIRELKLNPVIQIAGSSEEYGLVGENETPIKENNPLRPLSPYAVSKVAQDKLAYQYYKSHGLKTVITRCFNTEGPRRGKQFVISTFANQIAKIEKGLQSPEIYVGNLEAYRDFTHVKDIVRALWLSIEKCKFGEPYNIGSDKTHQIKEVLETLLSFTEKQIEIKKDPKRMRPSDVPILLSDSTKFRDTTGWEPRIGFKTILLDTLNYWRKELKA
ncbi:MAG: GDP-mannose 4,6-dehydratase [Candidatus Nealsonbacteria bacterium]